MQTIKLMSIFLPMVAAGCRTRKHSGVSWGGEFPSIGVASPAEWNFLPKQSKRVLAKQAQWDCAAGHSPELQATDPDHRAVDQRYKPRPKFIRIDSLPKLGKFNGADSMLRKADNLLYQYEEDTKFKRDRSAKLLVAFSVFLIADVLLFAAASQMGNVAGPNMIVVLLLVFLIVIAAFSLIFGLIMLGGLFIAAMVSLFNSRRRLKRMRNEAIKYIMDAPLHAPDSRRAEYEIRSLRMLRTEMSWPQAQSKVIQIRKMMNDDPSNPWYSLLKQTAEEMQISWTAI